VGLAGGRQESKEGVEEERKHLPTCREQDLFRPAAWPRPRRARPCWDMLLPVCVFVCGMWVLVRAQAGGVNRISSAEESSEGLCLLALAGCGHTTPPTMQPSKAFRLLVCFPLRAHTLFGEGQGVATACQLSGHDNAPSFWPHLSIATHFRPPFELS